VFRGDVSEIPRRCSSNNVDYASENIHFGGYLIGYVLWGYILIAVFAMIVGVIVDIVITYGMVKFAESVLKIIIPPILFAIFQYYMNKILAQYVFLQQGGDVLSINHRRILMVFLYFNFFLDAFLGFISSILRIIKTTIAGIVYMCRLDYSSMGRKLETFDAGFSAYCGFMHTECAHRHPVLLYFSSLLVREYLYKGQTTRCSKARRRWYLAVFLLKNPTLIYRRKRFFIRTETDETKMMLIGRKNMQTMFMEEPSIATHPVRPFA
jgi:cytochrome c oxidase subunit IV